MAVDQDTLDMLADYECPECGLLVEDGKLTYVMEWDADSILGGDEHGFIRCPDCGEELEQTLDASLDMLKMVAERAGAWGLILFGLIVWALR